jgi:hypothetical protein
LAKYLDKRIEKNWKFGEIKKIITVSLEECFDDLEKDWKAIFQQNLKDMKYTMCGSCALVTVITPIFIITANVGDS